MIEKEEYDKKIGRFISKKSGLVSKVSVLEYNFGELTPDTSILTDNVDGTIIHARYHEDEEISRASVEPDKFNDELIPPDMRPPLMIPVDFTGDWMKQKMTKRRRGTNAFDNEEEALAEINEAFSDIIGQEDLASDDPSKKDQAANETNDKGASLDASHTSSSSSEEHMKDDESQDFQGAEGPTPISSPDVSDLSELSEFSELTKAEKDERVSQQASMDYLSQKINKFNDEKRHEEAPIATDEAESAPANDTHEAASFIPMETQAGPQSTSEVSEVDKKNVEDYLSARELKDIKDKALEIALKDIDVDKVVEEAKSRGYQDGFREGETKASLSARSETEKVLENIGSLVDEFEKLKFNILENVQDNFQEITQAVCEAVLGKELSVYPERFASLIGNAIREAVPSDTFVIKVNENNFKKLSEVDSAEISGKLQIDDALSDEEFKVDSNLTSVTSSIKDIVRDLLERADMSIFEEEDDGVKAG